MVSKVQDIAYLSESFSASQICLTSFVLSKRAASLLPAPIEQVVFREKAVLLGGKNFGIFENAVVFVGNADVFWAIQQYFRHMQWYLGHMKLCLGENTEVFGANTKYKKGKGNWVDVF